MRKCSAANKAFSPVAGAGITLSASLLASKYTISDLHNSMKSIMDTKKEIGLMS